MMAQLENQRESVSGVSLDEEMINLIKFQNAYTAAAKLITTADEMMQTVLQMV
jgi:flagellar hook-associated protein 1 FlgK